MNVNSEAIDAAFDDENIKTDPLAEDKEDSNDDTIQESSPEITSEQTVETTPEQPAEIPPVPESGLPDGWTMEQWKWYGAEWLEKNK